MCMSVWMHAHACNIHVRAHVQMQWHAAVLLSFLPLFLPLFLSIIPSFIPVLFLFPSSALLLSSPPFFPDFSLVAFPQFPDFRFPFAFRVSQIQQHTKY